MWKHFALIVIEIILVAAVGFFANIAATQLKISSAYVWIALILLLLILIPTTWFRVRLDAGKDWVGWRRAIPESVTFSISIGSLQNTLRLLLGLILNGVLFGWFIAYASIFAVRLIPELGYVVESAYYSVRLGGLPGALSFEIVGVFAIGFASMFVCRRLSFVAGILFCIAGSLAFSITHLSLLPFQNISWTILGNLASSLLISVIGRMVLQPITEFWTNLLKG